MGEGEKKLPRAAGAGVVLITAATYEAMRRALEEDVLEPDPRDFRVERRGGRKVFGLKDEGVEDAGGGGRMVCALGTEVGLAGGTVYLKAGSIHAAGVHAAVGGDGTAFTPVIGDVVWAEVEISAVVEDGVLTGEWSASGAQLGSGGAVPDDHEWTDAAAVGKAYAPLGRWEGDGGSPEEPMWIGESCGDVTFRFCRMSYQRGVATFYRG